MWGISGRRCLKAAAGCGLLAFSITTLNSQALVTSWDSTSTKAFPLGSSISLSALAANSPVHVTLALKLQNQTLLNSFLTNLRTPGNPQFGQYMTPAQFAANFSPTAQQVQPVVDYLTQSGFTNIKVSSNRVLINADATAAIAESAFNTQLSQFLLNGKTVYAPTQDLKVPTSLNGIVLSVMGLQTAYRKTLHLQRAGIQSLTQSASVSTASKVVSKAAARPNAATPAVPPISAYTPLAFRTAYDAGTTSQGSNTVIAISTEGDDLSTVIADLRQAERDNNLPFVPVTVVQSAPLPDPVDTSGDDEWDLDSQSSTGIAGNVKQVIFYNTSDLGDSLINAYNDFTTQNIARVGNMSYGGCEILDDATGATATNDQAFMQAVAQGQTWFASAGDAGAACGVLINLGVPDAGVPAQVETPASSPYVVAVGGTSLFTDANYNYAEEITWTGTGGGTSLYETAPSWQSGIVPLGTGGLLRGVPDISMDAGFNVGPVLFYSAADTVVGGEHEEVIGTSLASPLAVGVWSRYVTDRCDSLGFAAPVIYALDTTGGPLSTATGFNDVIVGSNGGFAATPGWDYTTGFGSFDISLVDQALPAIPKGCTADNAPSAILTASVNSGAAPLSVSFDGSGSSDPDAGDSIAYYVLDYGDGSAPVFQTTPAFGPHSYANAGTYTASLQVRDTFGGYSPVGTLATLASTQTITVGGVPLACGTPGVLAITSPPGVAGVEGVDPEMGNGSDDLLSVYISEPTAVADQLVVTMNVASLSTLPSLFRWVTYFDIPEDPTNNYYVSMDTSTGSPAYTYGMHGVVPVAGLADYTELGTLDAASTYNADGSITLILDKSAIGLKTGDVLTDISSSIRVSTPDDPTGTLPLGEGLTVDSGGDPSSYTIIGNDVCAADLGLPPPTSGTSTGGTSGGTTGGNSTGGASGGASGGTSTGGASSGGTSGGTTGGSSTGGASGGAGGGTSTGGTSGGGTSGGTTGGTSGGGNSTGSGSTGGTSGGDTTSTGGTSGGTTGGSSTHGFFGGGAFGEALIPLAMLAGLRRRRKLRAR